MAQNRNHLQSPLSRIGRSLGRVIIGPQEQGLVFKNGCYNRALPPGDYPPLNRLQERLIVAPLALRAAKAQASATSCDGFDFTFDITVRYFVDLSEAFPDRQAAQAEVLLKEDAERIFNGRVRLITAVGLSKMVKDYAAQALLCGNARVQIQRRLASYVRGVLEPEGYRLDRPESLFIEAVHPPEVVLEARKTAYIISQIAEAVSQYPADVREAVMRTLLAERGQADLHIYEGLGIAPPGDGVWSGKDGRPGTGSPLWPGYQAPQTQREMPWSSNKS